MHGGRDSAESFFRSVNASFSSNADHSFRSSAHRSPNRGTLFHSMVSEFKNQVGGDELVDGRAENEALCRWCGCVLLASCELVDTQADDNLSCLASDCTSFIWVVDPEGSQLEVVEI